MMSPFWIIIIILLFITVCLQIIRCNLQIMQLLEPFSLEELLVQNMCRTNAMLELTGAGDLILRHADGALAWSTNTAGKSVVGLNLTETGNLVLFDAKNSAVWQSFDHPTDVLVPGQILVSGTNLTASASSSEGGVYSLSMTDRGLAACIQSDPPQAYYRHIYAGTKPNAEASYAKNGNGSLDLFVNVVEPQKPDMSYAISQITEGAQYLKLEPDGHLRAHQWNQTEVDDILKDYIDECQYPLICGKYGICSGGQCSYPNGTSFREINDRRPDLGCSEVIPVTCEDSDSHRFLDLVDVNYFAFVVDISSVDMKSCKEACLKNCSCKAAVFRYGSNSSNGRCYLQSEIFSLMNNDKDLTHYNSSVSIKEQIAPNATPTLAEKLTSILGPILGSILGVVCVAVAVFVYRRRGKSEQVEEEYLDHVPGMPTRFSFGELATATDNFSKKLGEGGFGSVFEGSFVDGTRIAVKRLDGVVTLRSRF